MSEDVHICMSAADDGRESMSVVEHFEVRKSSVHCRALA